MPDYHLTKEIDFRDPMDALSRLGAGPGTVLLDSVAPHPELGCWSWLATEPFGRFTSRGGKAFWNGAPLDGHPVEALRRMLARFPGAASPELPFSGGVTGYFSYEAGQLFERLPEPRWQGGEWPDMELWFHDVGVAFDVVDRRAFLVSTGHPEADPARREDLAQERAEWLLAKLAAGSSLPPSPPIVLDRDAWRSNTDKAGFKRMVERTRELIAAGDVFQANLAQAFRAELPSNFDPLQLYRQLRSANPAPFGAFLATPERIIASTLARRFSAAARRRGGDPADQRNAPPFLPPGDGSQAGRRASGQRQGPRREHHDSRPDAQRPVARLSAGQRRNPCPLRAGKLCRRPPSGFGSARTPEARNGRAASRCGMLSRRLGDRRSQNPGHGNHPRTGA
jgi:hypothetical protein